jgi:hypothetical protein
LVRAAQHMIEVHGQTAAAIAEQRASQSDDLLTVRRWYAIAETIREMRRAKDSGQGR